VIRQALANAGLEPRDVDMVEAHGTGTALGDPIEAGALLATYGQERETPLRLGSLKSNIGHAQAAAGVGGVIKAVMAMREGVMPKTLHASEPSSKIDWSAGKVELLNEPLEWEPNGSPRRAAVSSFGISGTNAHLILEEAPTPTELASEEVPEEEHPLPGALPLVLSAKSEPALLAQAEQLASHLREHPRLELADVAYSLAIARTRFEHRAVLLGASREETLEALDSLGAAAEHPGIARGRAREDGKSAFLFPGQGSQWQGMALELLEDSPVFARHMAECEEALEPHLDFVLGDVLAAAPGAPPLEGVEVVQPALFAVMVSLARLWAACGVEPSSVAGHSQGEIAAAHIAGGLTLPDAARLAAVRAKLIARIAGEGGMVSVGASPERVGELISPWEGEIETAAYNGPSSTVVSGTRSALDQLLALCEGEGQPRAREVAVDYASHSRHVEVLREEILEAFADISPRQGSIPFHSTVTGELLDTAELDAEYWYRNLRQPVLFEAVSRGLIESGHSSLIEVSPHPVLSLALSETIEATGAEAAVSMIETLRREEGGAERFALSLATAHAAGAPIAWEAFFAGTGAKAVPLPTYPFQHERYWLSPAAALGDPASIGQRAITHPFLAAAIEDPREAEVTFSGRISLQEHPWLADHAVLGEVLLPGTALLELALSVAEDLGCEGVGELTLSAPMLLPAEGALALRVYVSAPDTEGERRISIHSRPDSEEGEWSTHAEGELTAKAPELPEPLEHWPPAAAEPLDLAHLYDRFAEAGFEYGESFEGLIGAWRSEGELYAEVEPTPTLHPEDFAIHPASLDSALHALAGTSDGTNSKRLPFAWREVSLPPAGDGRLRVRISGDAATELRLAIADGEGMPLGRATLALREFDPAAFGAARRDSGDLLGLEWRPLQLPEPDEPAEAPQRLELASPAQADRLAAARELCAELLGALQSWLAEGEEGTLAILSRGAVAIDPATSPDPALAAAWGMARSAQAEHPGRFFLIDTDDSEASRAALDSALALAGQGEPQVALREGVALGARIETASELTPPAGPWRLDVAPGKRGSLDSLSLLPAAELEAPLEPSAVRIEMRAAGLNFRDVLIALGIYPDEVEMGSEGAGIVLEVGSQVSDLAPGDRVMGMIANAFGPVAIAERARLVTLPRDWSFEQGAASPAIFLTALFALADLGELKSGEKVLIHAGAGGVGMAAIGIAQSRGAEVFATASPSKWPALRERGIAADHIASSRDLGFKEKFLALTEGEGVDVVLNSLSGEFVDASLELLGEGGRFLEMGKTDVRDAEELAAAHPGLALYRAFDLSQAGEERVSEMLSEVTEQLERGELRHPPITSWDLRRPAGAFRHLREGRNVGKVVLSSPQPLNPNRTVLITGGTGALGALVARHLVEAHGARHLLLTSRSGEAAKGALDLRAQLQELGAEVQIAAADVAQRAELEALLDEIPPEHPLGAVIHCAAVLDDGLIASLDQERLEKVMGPKADAAWHLHELSVEAELSHFILFSSIAGLIGGAAQASYAAANSFLDALAAERRAQGLAATSIAWGLWGVESGAIADLDAEQFDRAIRQAADRLALVPISAEHGLALFDAALTQPGALIVPAQLDLALLRTRGRAGSLPTLFEGLVRVAARAGAEGGSLARRLAAVSEAERGPIALEVVRGHVAAVLGHDSVTEVNPDAAFRDLGFDSLAAVELRNRLSVDSALVLTSSLAFDYPTTAAVAEHLALELSPGSRPDPAQSEEEREVRRALAEIPLERLREAGLLGSLIELAGDDAVGALPAEDGIEQIDSMDIGDLVQRTLASPEDAEAPIGGGG
jgi:acyl transferase domain-containing protein/NADPH-dependent curcumin reductase CurA/NAD(P)-dependent dehydrogenase (short-subunit alcohol dehydrogenase family)/acyl carrier protein